MKTIIKLTDLAGIPTPESKHAQHCREHLAQARKYQEDMGLRYNNRTGRLHDKTGELERYSRQSDFVPHTCEQDVMEWEFSRHINNSADRISRGCTP